MIPDKIATTSGGFTLVELLVVLAVVAVLGGISLSAVQRGISKAKQTSCISNLRQIGTATMLYAGENNGSLPQTSHTGSAAKSWIYTLSPYLGKIDAVRICPADPNAKRRLAERGTSYTLNSYVFNPSYDGDGNVVTKFDRLNLIPKPSETFLAFVVSDQKFGVGADHTHSEEWRNWTSLLVDISPDRFRTGGAANDRAQGASNYLYADGHASSLAALTVKTLIEQGKNLALPPE